MNLEVLETIGLFFYYAFFVLGSVSLGYLVVRLTYPDVRLYSEKKKLGLSALVGSSIAVLSLLLNFGASALAGFDGHAGYLYALTFFSLILAFLASRIYFQFQTQNQEYLTIGVPMPSTPLPKRVFEPQIMPASVETEKKQLTQTMQTQPLESVKGDLSEENKKPAWLEAFSADYSKIEAEKKRQAQEDKKNKELQIQKIISSTQSLAKKNEPEKQLSATQGKPTQNPLPNAIPNTTPQTTAGTPQTTNTILQANPPITPAGMPSHFFGKTESSNPVAIPKTTTAQPPIMLQPPATPQPKALSQSSPTTETKEKPPLPPTQQTQPTTQTLSQTLKTPVIPPVPIKPKPQQNQNNTLSTPASSQAQTTQPPNSQSNANADKTKIPPVPEKPFKLINLDIPSKPQTQKEEKPFLSPWTQKETPSTPAQAPALPNNNPQTTSESKYAEYEQKQQAQLQTPYGKLEKIKHETNDNKLVQLDLPLKNREQEPISSKASQAETRQEIAKVKAAEMEAVLEDILPKDELQQTSAQTQDQPRRRRYLEQGRQTVKVIAPQNLAEKEEFSSMVSEIYTQLEVNKTDETLNTAVNIKNPQTKKTPQLPQQAQEKPLSMEDLMEQPQTTPQPGTQKETSLEANPLFAQLNSISASLPSQSTEQTQSKVELVQIQSQKGMGCPTCHTKNSRIIFCPYCGTGMCANCSPKIIPKADHYTYVCPKCLEDVTVKKKNPTIQPSPA